MKGSRALVILGPTAVGKSQIALELAREFASEIISADSVQVYKYLNIGSAKPAPAIQKKIPHHLIDLVEPDRDFDAGAYLVQGQRVISDFIKKDKFILLVGGTGLYLRAIIDGLTDLPGKDEGIRKNLYQLIEGGAAGKLYQQLQAVDPAYAALIHPHDYRRLVRALEVYQLTGKPFSYLHQETAPPFPEIDFLQIGLQREKEELYQLINQRVEEMFAQGLVEEVRNLLEVKHYSPELNSLKSLGYHQVTQYLQGQITLDQAINEVKKQTRHYAKRQMTWFKKDKRIKWLNLTSMTVSEAVEVIKSNYYSK